MVKTYLQSSARERFLDTLAPKFFGSDRQLAVVSGDVTSYTENSGVVGGKDELRRQRSAMQTFTVD